MVRLEAFMSAMAVSVKGREEFARSVGEKLRGLKGIQRAVVEFSFLDREQTRPGPTLIVVYTMHDGIPEEVVGVLARLQRAWQFEIRVVPTDQTYVIFDDNRNERYARPTIWAVASAAPDGVPSWGARMACDRLAEALKWGAIDDTSFRYLDATEEDRARGFDWSARFVAGETSMHVAGVKYPGTSSPWPPTFAITWWK